MLEIATLTMNPALDVSTATARVAPTHKLRCGPPRLDPGGGGINVARVIEILGGEAVAVYPAGGPMGDLVHRLLQGSGVEQKRVSIAGDTRQSFTVDEVETGQQYRFVLPGPTLSRSERERCLDAVAELDPPPAYLVASGSFPPGVPPEFCREIATMAERIGARLVLDTSGEALLCAAKHGVYLMKPSLSELEAMVGKSLQKESDQIAAAQSIVSRGGAEIVVLSLGAEGALLVTKQLAERFRAPNVPVRSAVGAGDSTVGAIVLALQRGWDLKEAVRYGMAAGAATIMTPGTELCRREDVERLFKEMSATEDEVRA